MTKTPRNELRINPLEYPGGVAIWAAIIPAIDTTDIQSDAAYIGIHVHARRVVDGDKLIDTNYDVVHLDLSFAGMKGCFTITPEMATSYRASMVLGLAMDSLVCPACGRRHLDAGRFAVRPHKIHLCEHCGTKFPGPRSSVSNPILSIQKRVRDKTRACTIIAQPKRRLQIPSSDFKGGVQIWGSAEALIWTGNHEEEYGIHVHAYDGLGCRVIDDTYGYVRVDGIHLDIPSTRLYTIQKSLRFIRTRLGVAKCASCGSAICDIGRSSTRPNTIHVCAKCGTKTKTSVALISNPISELANYSTKSHP